MTKIDFTWPGEVVSMIEKGDKYHVKINCSGQLIEVVYLPGKEDYSLGDKVLLRGHIMIEEIKKRNHRQDHQTDL